MIKRIALAVALALALLSCTGEGRSADRGDTQQALNQQEHYRRIGQVVPFLDFSQDLETFRQIYVLKNEQAIATHTIFMTTGTGRIVDDCQSTGYPISAGSQISNPERATRPGTDGYLTLPQPEPNGLWTDPNTRGTYVICVLDSGKRVPVYSELDVIAYPYPIEVSNDRMSVTPAGDSEVDIQFGEVQDLGEAASEPETGEGQEE